MGIKNKEHTYDINIFEKLGVQKYLQVYLIPASYVSI